MIEKIVSGGQTGADRAALDAAIALGIPHGGWLPKGRKAEDGPLSEAYQLREMSTAVYKDRTFQNVMDSDGTLIISRGPLTGGSAVTVTATEVHEKPCFHVNLKATPAFLAASKIADWITDNHISVLNVAGPRASKDPKIYTDVKKIIETIYYLSMAKANMPDPAASDFREKSRFIHSPQTIAAAVDIIIAEMPLRDKATVANMTEREVLRLEATLGRYIAKKLDDWSTNNSAFVASYLTLTGEAYREKEAKTVMMLELWRRLKRTHKLRVVK